MNVVLEKSGRILEIMGVVKIGEGLSIREFVMESLIKVGSSLMVSEITFRLVNDKIDMLNGIEVGDIVHVQFDIVGKKWVGRNGVQRFNNLDVWSMTKDGVHDDTDEVEMEE